MLPQLSHTDALTICTSAPRDELSKATCPSASATAEDEARWLRSSAHSLSGMTRTQTMPAPPSCPPPTPPPPLALLAPLTARSVPV